MADVPRRRFLKASAGVVSGLALTSCGEESPEIAQAAPGLDRTTLDALARIALPYGALGDAGTLRAVDEFLAWLDGFEPVAERDHGYGTSDVAYGPPHPAPLWASQLEALNLEADKRYATPYAMLDPTRQRQVLEHQLPQHLTDELPYAGAAPHIAIGLIAWYYATPDANDLVLQARVGKQMCRGLDSAPRKPEPLDG